MGREGGKGGKGGWGRGLSVCVGGENDTADTCCEVYPYTVRRQKIEP